MVASVAVKVTPEELQGRADESCFYRRELVAGAVSFRLGRHAQGTSLRSAKDSAGGCQLVRRCTVHGLPDGETKGLRHRGR